MLLYIFTAIVLLVLNEYRLIKKYILAHNNIHEKTRVEKFILTLFKPLFIFKNWVYHKVLNNELNYN
jgi:hypothetical protein